MDARRIFLDYADRYDLSVGMMALKRLHTLEVAAVMDELTDRIGIGGRLKELAMYCAYFHDIGRFEQVKRYGTFYDLKSEDHAQLGLKVLEEERFLKTLPEEEETMIRTAIGCHNLYKIPDEVTGDTLILCRLIRDADKADIFRVFATEDMADTTGASTEQIRRQTVTRKVLDCIREGRSVDRTLRRTDLDKWIGFLGFFFDLNYTETMEIIRERGFYRRPFDETTFEQEEAAVQVKEALERTEAYIEERIRCRRGMERKS